MINDSFLPVRPRYRIREVDGQRLSAKADDRVCCFSPVRAMANVPNVLLFTCKVTRTRGG